MNEQQPLNQTQFNPQINPQIKAVMDMVKNSGMSAKDLFYKLAKEKGIDPDAILNQLK